MPLPSIVCFHGSGSNAEIFYCQTRALRKELEQHVEFIFVNAPFPSGPGPGIEPCFSDSGPFYRWRRARGSGVPKKSQTADKDDDAFIVMRLLESLFEEHESERIIGVMGFSQGTCVVGGLLARQQLLNSLSIAVDPILSFGIVCMGAGAECAPLPLPLTTHRSQNGPELAVRTAIRLPTLHLQGASDPVFFGSHALAKEFYSEESSEIIVADAGHHMPTRHRDVLHVAEAIRRLVQRARVD